jgi:hypothetical protein
VSLRKSCALKAAKQFERQLKFHTLEAIEVIERVHHQQAGRPRKDAQARRVSYHLQATLVPKQRVIQAEVTCAGCFLNGYQHYRPSTVE